MIDVFGILESCGEPPCPVCGEPLGYYAEFGDEIDCYNCGCKMHLNYETIIHYEVFETGKDYEIVKAHFYPYCKMVNKIGNNCE